MNGLTDREILADLLEEKEYRKKRRKFWTYFPDTGPLRRELYSRHMHGFGAMKDHKQVWSMSGNRTGKTEGWLCYAIAASATGEYPEWWPGRKWDRPVKICIAGKTGTTTRDILQKKLMGEYAEMGTGLIPADAIIKTTAKSGIAEAFDTVYIKHKNGGISVIRFKSYDQGRKAFEGEEYDIIGMDEEPPPDVYEEAALRTMTPRGSIWASFTPLDGYTELIANEYPEGFPEGMIKDGLTVNGKYVWTMTWDDVPHLTAEMKDEMWATIAPHLREARKKGLPAVGSGLIYPVPGEDYICAPFPIPDEWKKGYGMDVGWNRTAVVFFAINPDTNVVYVYDEHYKGQAEPVIHAQAVKNRGEWLPGVMDPASRGRSQIDGRKLVDEYRNCGLDVYFANNAREAGILKVWQALTTGRLKIFSNLQHIFQEIRIYRRDEDGQIVKNNDHLMDALRYAIMSGLERARISPAYALRKARREQRLSYGGGSSGWMGT